MLLWNARKQNTEWIQQEKLYSSGLCSVKKIKNFVELHFHIWNVFYYYTYRVTHRAPLFSSYTLIIDSCSSINFIAYVSILSVIHYLPCPVLGPRPQGALLVGVPLKFACSLSAWDFPGLSEWRHYQKWRHGLHFSFWVLSLTLSYQVYWSWVESDTLKIFWTFLSVTISGPSGQDPASRDGLAEAYPPSTAYCILWDHGFFRQLPEVCWNTDCDKLIIQREHHRKTLLPPQSTRLGRLCYYIFIFSAMLFTGKGVRQLWNKSKSQMKRVKL